MKIIVVGCGPKGIAIQTKLQVLKKLHKKPISKLVIIDKKGIAANWGGDSGFTDGENRLCTLPDKDIGFPYSSIFGEQVNAEMFKYSWSSFLIDTNKYREWIERGKPQPLHKDWYEYLKWVWERTNTNTQFIKGDVTKIQIVPTNNIWNIKVKTDNGPRTVKGNSLVLTGPGKPIHTKLSPPEDENHLLPLIFDGKSYWEKKFYLDHIKNVFRHNAPSAKIGLLGTGETAATIIHSLLDELREFNFKIYCLSRHVSIFSRGENYFGNHFFSCPDDINKNWQDYSLKLRKEFIERTDRGVLSTNVLNIMNHSEKIEIIYLNDNWDVSIEGSKIKLQPDKNNSLKSIHLDCFVDATGFDPLIFINDQFDDETRNRLVNHIIQNEKYILQYYNSIKDAQRDLGLDPLILIKNILPLMIGKDLSVDGFYPKLYLPMIAGLSQGPGFPKLSALGLLSDRIFEPLIEK